MRSRPCEKSRQQLTKSSGSTKDLVTGKSRTSGRDTSRSWRKHSGYATTARFSGLGLKSTSEQVAEFGLKTRYEHHGSAWRQWRVRIEEKILREVLGAVRCTDLHLDHFTPGVKWFSSKYLKAGLDLCSSSINKRRAVPI